MQAIATNYMQQETSINCENWTFENFQELFMALKGMEGFRLTLTFGQAASDSRLQGSTVTKIDERVLGQYLGRLGVAPHLRGYSYLKTGIRHCLDTPEEMESVTKLLYPAIAKEHCTTSGRVEHGIRHAISLAWEKRNEEEWGKIFGFREAERPTNSEFLAALTDHILMGLPG